VERWKGIGRGVEKKKASSDMRGRDVSDTQRRKPRCSSELGCWRLLGSAQAGEQGKRETGMRGDGPHAREQAGRGESGLRVSWAKNQEEKRIPFLFSFSNISKHFQMILNPLLNLNQTTQYKIFKCNSMSAQSHFYPYI
jgi:hypothetical protein